MSNVFSLHSPKHPISQAVAEKENFQTSGWKRAPVNKQPELKRIDHLLGKISPETGRNLSKARKIKISGEKLSRRFAKKSDRLDLMHQTLEPLNGGLEMVPIALSPISNAHPVKKAG